jgi:uncharacterized membrane protein YeaQ/YmgE (transglycosylase-associated protein family)
MDIQIIWTVIYGAICGYVASRILGGEGFGFLGNIVIGCLGSLLGSYLVKKFSIPLFGGAAGNLVSSVAGALILIIFLETVMKVTKDDGGSGRRRR